MSNIKVLTITSEWPTSEHPNWVPFIVQQVNYLRKAGIDVDVFSFRGSKNPFNYIKAWFRVRKTLRAKHYDLIHAHFGQSGLIALPKSVPLIVTFHGSDLQGDVTASGLYTAQGKILQVVSKFVALFADEIVVVSHALGQMINPKKTRHVIPCGVDLDLFAPMDQCVARQKLSLAMDQKIILFGGRPEMPVKRFKLAKQVVELVVEKGVEMVALNSASHSQMPCYLNACDVLLLTSSHEGSPTIIKEALACNLPIVSTDVGDVRKRIGNIEGCVVCDDDHPETIATALKQVLARGKRINGRESVLDLDENLIAQKIIKVYKHALEKQHK